jgi:hypothetical protein
MRIGLIGGLTRSEAQLVKMANDAGHELEFHTGEIRGRGACALRSIIERSDFVIILITVNSHQAVWIAKRAVREFKRPSIVMRKCGPDTFRDLLDLLGQPIATVADPGSGRRRGRYKYQHAGW